MSADLERNRLDPETLRSDARYLLEENEDDLIGFVASLLKQIREDCDRRDAITEGYEWSNRRTEQRAEEAERERNDYREALRAVKHAVRPIRIGRW
jgi:hypothetical protein